MRAGAARAEVGADAVGRTDHPDAARKRSTLGLPLLQSARTLSGEGGVAIWIPRAVDGRGGGGSFSEPVATMAPFIRVQQFGGGAAGRTQPQASRHRPAPVGRIDLPGRVRGRGAGGRLDGQTRLDGGGAALIGRIGPTRLRGGVVARPASGRRFGLGRGHDRARTLVARQGAGLDIQQDQRGLGLGDPARPQGVQRQRRDKAGVHRDRSHDQRRLAPGVDAPVARQSRPSRFGVKLGGKHGRFRAARRLVRVAAVRWSPETGR